MKITLSKTGLDGQEFTLTLESRDFTNQQEADLDFGDARGRITGLMSRELDRMATVASIAVRDAHMARQREVAANKERARRRAAGEKEPARPPSIILGAGTKDPEIGRRYVDAASGRDLGSTLDKKK